MRGVSLRDSFRLLDSRGSFTKILKYDDISSVPNFELREVFSTSSHKGALRGMHVQVQEAANWRLIQVLRGVAFDVLLDLRLKESTYGQVQINLMSEENPQTILVPPGVAHGFQAMTDVEILYLTSHQYEPSLDIGVNPFSIGVDWPLEVTSISVRDLNLPQLSEFSI